MYVSNNVDLKSGFLKVFYTTVAKKLFTYCYTLHILYKIN